MATSNKQRVRSALDALFQPLASFVEQELRAEYGEGWAIKVNDPSKSLDTYQALQTIIVRWKDVFDKRFDYHLRNYAYGVREVRNNASHDKSFTADETTKALIDVLALLEIVSAPQSAKDQVDALKEAHYRNQLKKEESASETASDLGISGLDQTNLKPWREVAIPHEDVRSGELDQAEFAADLKQIFEGSGRDEYLDPKAFYARTFLTNGLTEMLERAVQRLAGVGGDPVVELQVTFGGGKTHSMIALYHLCSGVPLADLPGMEGFAEKAGIAKLSHVKRAILVGTSLRPGTPRTKEDGTEVRTIWGELAWQLAGKEGFNIVAEDDANSTSPGDALDELFELAGPSVVLIDEWVAYARQLHGRDGHMLPAGSFDTQFTFAQELCQAARRAKNVVVCISVPASTDAGGDLDVTTDHVGGEDGRAATVKLKAAVGRQNLVWRPATTHESFEIVRRRLFEPMESEEAKKARAEVVDGFRMHYLQHEHEVPEQASKATYKEHMLSSYPIHPEVFKVLFDHWGSLERFQRTRGVLKLMSQVIHELWKSGDKSPMILPCTIPIGTSRVEAALTNFLGDTWNSVISHDVEGNAAAAVKIDNAHPQIGSISGARRVARAVFMDTAPMKSAADRGMDGKKLRLACTIPGERTHLIDGALEKLKEESQYLYHKDGRSWFDTQVNINVLAKDLGQNLTKEHVQMAICDELRKNVQQKGSFPRVIVDADGADVPDEEFLRLVVLGPAFLHSRNSEDSSASIEARHIVEKRGDGNRLNKNSLLFCAADGSKMVNLDRVMRNYLAWRQIYDERETRNLEPAHQQEARSRRDAQKLSLDHVLAETYSFLLVPTPGDQLTGFKMRDVTINGSGNRIAERAWQKAAADEICTAKLGWRIVEQKLNSTEGLRDMKVIAVKDLEAYHAKYLYMNRVTEPSVVARALSEGMVDAFGPGWAKSYDEATEELSGVVLGEGMSPFELEEGYYVVREKAEQYIASAPDVTENPVEPGVTTTPGPAPAVKQNVRFSGSVELSLTEMASEVMSIRDNIVKHLDSNGATVRVTLDVVVDAPDGIDDSVVRIVGENKNSLGMTGHFEKE
jgi:predicted AAA+ superfamily ATPase